MNLSRRLPALSLVGLLFTPALAKVPAPALDSVPAPALARVPAPALDSVPAPALAKGTLPALPQGPVPKVLHLTFGVYQTDKPTEMYKQFTPLLEALQDDVGTRLSRPVDIQLKIFQSYEAGIQALVAGDVDFVHFGPASYITAKAQEPGIRLLAMEHENHKKVFQGVIVVAKNSPIKSIEELRGKTFAFGDKNSTIGRYLVQALLVEHGIHAKDLGKWEYLDRHDMVAAAVEHGDFDAGSVKFSTFQKANAGDKLRVLTPFDNVTKPVVARKGLDDAVGTAIQQSLFALTEKTDTDVLKALKVSGFVESSDSDYDFVRKGMKKAAEFEDDAPNRQTGR